MGELVQTLVVVAAIRVQVPIRPRNKKLRSSKLNMTYTVRVAKLHQRVCVCVM